MLDLLRKIKGGSQNSTIVNCRVLPRVEVAVNKELQSNKSPYIFSSYYILYDFMLQISTKNCIKIKVDGEVRSKSSNFVMDVSLKFFNLCKNSPMTSNLFAEFKVLTSH
jgi:hypothetical protein